MELLERHYEDILLDYRFIRAIVVQLNLQNSEPGEWKRCDPTRCDPASKTFLLYPMRSMGESIGIGLEASSTSKGPQAKTTKPMDSIKVTYCRIQLGRILARNGFAKNYMGSRPEAKKCHFFIKCVRMDGWMDVIVISAHDFFHTVAPIEMKLKTYH